MEGGRNHRQKLGQLGEDIACSFLEDNGHTILERNFRSGHLEIDIISTDRNGIHFVEVKTRRQSIQAPPQENVDRMKQQRIARAAKSFLKRRRQHEHLECFFDIFAVTFESEGIKTEWIPEAFIPIYL